MSEKDIDLEIGDDSSTDPEPIKKDPIKKQTKKVKKKTTKKSTKKRDNSGQFAKKDKPEEIVEDDSTDTTKLLESVAEGLRKQMPEDLDLSHLSLPDEIKTMQSMLKKGEEEEEEGGDDPPGTINPLEVPAEPEETYVTISEENERGSFLQRLNKFRTVGGKIKEKLGFNIE